MGKELQKDGSNELLNWLCWLTQGENLAIWQELGTVERTSLLEEEGFDSAVIQNQAEELGNADAEAGMLLNCLLIINQTDAITSRDINKFLSDKGIQNILALSAGNIQHINTVSHKIAYKEQLELLDRFDPQVPEEGTWHTDNKRVEIEKEAPGEAREYEYTRFSYYGPKDESLWGDYYGSLNPAKGYTNLVAYAIYKGKDYNIDYLSQGNSAELWWGSNYQHSIQFKWNEKTITKIESSISKELNEISSHQGFSSLLEQLLKKEEQAVLQKGESSFGQLRSKAEMEIRAIQNTTGRVVNDYKAGMTAYRSLAKKPLIYLYLKEFKKENQFAQKDIMMIQVLEQDSSSLLETTKSEIKTLQAKKDTSLMNTWIEKNNKLVRANLDFLYLRHSLNSVVEIDFIKKLLPALAHDISSKYDIQSDFQNLEVTLTKETQRYEKAEKVIDQAEIVSNSTEKKEEEILWEKNQKQVNAWKEYSPESTFALQTDRLLISREEEFTPISYTEDDGQIIIEGGQPAGQDTYFAYVGQNISLQGSYSGFLRPRKGGFSDLSVNATYKGRNYSVYSLTDGYNQASWGDYGERTIQFKWDEKTLSRIDSSILKEVLRQQEQALSKHADRALEDEKTKIDQWIQKDKSIFQKFAESFNAYQAFKYERSIYDDWVDKPFVLNYLSNQYGDTNAFIAYKTLLQSDSKIIGQINQLRSALKLGEPELIHDLSIKLNDKLKSLQLKSDVLLINNWIDKTNSLLKADLDILYLRQQRLGLARLAQGLVVKKLIHTDSKLIANKLTTAREDISSNIQGDIDNVFGTEAEFKEKNMNLVMRTKQEESSISTFESTNVEPKIRTYKQYRPGGDKRDYYIVDNINTSRGEIEVNKEYGSSNGEIYSQPDYNLGKALMGISNQKRLSSWIERNAIQQGLNAYEVALMFGDSRKQAYIHADKMYIRSLLNTDTNLWRFEHSQWNDIIESANSRDGYRWTYGNNSFSSKTTSIAPYWSLVGGMDADLLHSQFMLTKHLWYDEHRKYYFQQKKSFEYTRWQLNEETKYAEKFHAAYIKNDWGVAGTRPIVKMWKAITAPERAINKTIQGWRDGDGFIGGLKVGAGVYTKTIKGEIHFMNHVVTGIVKDIDGLLNAMFSWIPGEKKLAKFVGKMQHMSDFLLKNIEKLPVRLVKQAFKLEKQFIKLGKNIVNHTASMQGVTKALKADSKGFRHSMKILSKGIFDIVTGQWKKIYDYGKEIRDGLRLYEHDKQILLTIKLKEHEIDIRRKMHNATPNLIRSPIDILNRDIGSLYPRIYQTEPKVLTDLRREYASAFAYFDSLGLRKQAKLVNKFRKGDISHKDVYNYIVANLNTQLKAAELIHPSISWLARYNLERATRIVHDPKHKKLTRWTVERAWKWTQTVDKSTRNTVENMKKHPKAFRIAFSSYYEFAYIDSIVNNFYHSYKSYSSQAKLIDQDDWTKWGKKQAGWTLHDPIETYLVPQIYVNFKTSPPTIVSYSNKEMSKAEQDKVNNYFTTNQRGYKLFTDLMLAYLIKLDMPKLTSENPYLNLNPDAPKEVIKTFYNFDENLLRSNVSFAFAQHRLLNDQYIAKNLEPKFSLYKKLYITSKQLYKELRREERLLKLLELPSSEVRQRTINFVNTSTSANAEDLGLLYKYDTKKRGKENLSYWQNVKSLVKSKNSVIYNQLASDKGENLTVGQILVSIMGPTKRPTLSPPTPAPIKPSGGNKVNSNTKQLSSNVWMLIRNYFMLEHHYEKFKYGQEESVIDKRLETKVDKKAIASADMEKDKVVKSVNREAKGDIEEFNDELDMEVDDSLELML